MKRNLFLIALVGAALAQAAAAASITDWLRLEQLQKSPVAFGLAADGGYRFNSTAPTRYDYGLSAELLFPLVSTARLRARLLELNLSPGSDNLLAFNFGIGLDALVGFPLGRTPVVPYVYAGGGFTATDNINQYSLRGGLGVEGHAAKYASIFVEVGAENDFPYDSKAIQARAAAGVRFGY